MPKYTRKNRATKSRNEKDIFDDTMSTDDGVSSCSNISDVTSVCDDDETINSSFIVTSENLDEKLEELTENLRSRDGKTRENALKHLETLLRQRILEKCENLLVENLLHCLRRSGENEGKLASNVASLLVLQMCQNDEEISEQRFRDVFLPIIKDSSKPTSQRAKFAEALGLISFLCSVEVSSTVDLMNELESIFSFCSPNEDGDFQKLENEFYELTTSALFSWTLLLTTLPVNESHNFVRKFAPKKICELLDSPNADFRNQAAEAVAILYEIGFEIQSVFAEPPEFLLTKLEQKSKESTKSKSKKEKRLQHATFREIFNWFEDGTTPDFQVKFSGETLQINSWTSRFYYSIFSKVLGSGTTIHLKENSFLRSIFNLEETENLSNKVEKERPSKTDSKYRTEKMKQNRDKKHLRYESFDC